MKLIREFEDFDWANNTLINPWELGYDLVFFDKVPTRKDVEDLIEMALTSHNLNGHNKKAWSNTDTRNTIIRKIINRANLSNRGVYLILTEDKLLWGSGASKEEYNKINYSNLIETNLTESDDLDWIRTTETNPWFEYDSIIFDIEPNREDVKMYIDMALNTRNIRNRDVWRGDHHSDITSIISYQKQRGLSILGINYTDMLQYTYDITHFSDKKSINYSQLIGRDTITESDELDWIRDIEPPIFKDAVIGQTYGITTTPLLLDAIRECDDTELIYLSKRATVIGKDIVAYNDVFCDHERIDIVPALFLEFLNGKGEVIDNFWVTEDMIQLH